MDQIVKHFNAETVALQASANSVQDLFGEFLSVPEAYTYNLFMTVNDFKKVLLERYPAATPEKLDEIVKMVDKNGDGKVDKGELLRLSSDALYIEEPEDIHTRVFLRYVVNRVVSA